MSEQYPGGFITKSPPTPQGPYDTSSAYGIWNLSQQAGYQNQGLWPTAGNLPPDPYFYDVTMLLTGNGTNGAQNNTFLDSSSNAFSITRNGNTTQGSFSPYGSLWSNTFNGTTGYLGNTSSALITAAVSTFTAEAWIFMTAAPTTDANNLGSTLSLDGQPAGTVNYLSFGPIASQKLRLRWFDGASKYAEGSTTLALNTWYHVAVVVNSNAITMYVNGVAETLSGTTTLTNRSGTSGNFAIGANYYSAFAGYVSNIRVTTTAVYSSGFTPSTTPLTAISGTVLLSCQSNRFIDNSSNAFALTPSGNPSVQRFSPFNPTSAYDTATIGGSGYFDGSGDYLTVPSSSNLDLGSGNFTIETWIYPQAEGGKYFLSVQGQANAYGAVAMAVYGTALIEVDISTTANSWTIVYSSPANSIALNAWNHVALVRVGSAFTLYLNGVGYSVGSTASALYNYSNLTRVGYNGNTSYVYNGYLTDTRIIKGTAIYTTNFTPPTAPLTAVSGTQLLLGYNNAGIPDSAMMNDLETVGNAQVSTSQAKYGTGSMYFNGASGTNLQFAGTPNVSFGTGDFTIEMWVYRTANTQGALITLGQNSGTNGAGLIFYPSTTTLSFVYYSGTNILSDTGSFTNNQWVHVALVRQSGTVYLYVGGVQKSSASFSTWNATGYNCCIGSWFDSASFNYTGYIDDLRITKGLARYTTTFTPPTKAFPTY